MSTLRVNTLQNTSGGTISGVGKVLQVTYAQNKDSQSISGNGFNVLSNFTGSITTTSSSNKVLVRVSMNLAGSSSYYTVSGRLYRGGSHITAASASDDGNRPGTFFTVGAQQWDNYGRYQVTSEYLDSPGSAATHSYTIALSDQRDAQLIYVNRGSYAANSSSSPIGMCSIICMEIAA